MVGFSDICFLIKRDDFHIFQMVLPHLTRHIRKCSKTIFGLLIKNVSIYLVVRHQKVRSNLTIQASDSIVDE